MRCSREIFVIVNSPVGGGVLHKRAKEPVVEGELGKISRYDLKTERFRACPHDSDRLRMTIMGDEKFPSIWNDRMKKCHCFGRSGGFVEKRGVGNVEAG